jgi:hypothetical protein
VRVIIGLVVLAGAGLAWAGGDERVAPVSDPVVKKECGSCHMVFPPQFLPARSWQKLVDGLSSHFGEDVTLPAEQRAAVLERLRSMAADAPGAGRAGSKFLAGLAPGETPLRITETPRWVKKHGRIRPEKWTSPAVKSKLNCAACHKQAEAGVYED